MAEVGPIAIPSSANDVGTQPRDALASMSDSSFIRPLVKSDLPELAAFNAAFEQHTRSASFWEARMTHWWITNPACKPDWVMGLGLESRGKLVGLIAGIPLRVVIEGSPSLAALIGTWRVDPAFRSQSLALSLSIEDYYGSLPCFIGTASQQAFMIHQSCGWQRVRENLGFTKVVSNWPRLILSKIFKNTKSPILPKLFLNGRESDEEDILDLVGMSWERALHTNQFGPVRDADYVSWYCLKSPTGRFSCFVNSDSKIEVDTFALTHHFGDGALYVVDVWSDCLTIDGIRKLLISIVKVAGAKGFHYVEVAHLNSAVQDVMESFSFGKNTLMEQRSLFRMPDGVPMGRSVDWPMIIGDFGI